MPGPNSLLSIGKKSLLAHQYAVEVVGNNVSNANTEGYSRQAVRFEDGLYLNYRPGQLGTGADAVEVIRYFDEFIESQYNGKMSEQQRWDKLAENLQSVEMILNEANSSGINAALTAFWNGWHTLSQNPDSTSARMALMGLASNLERAIQVAEEGLGKLQDQADDHIAKDVEAINVILSKIAEINRQINIDEEPGKNNVNGLRDQRALLVRQLAEKMDIRYIDHGQGNVTIMTTAGHTLVDRGEYFRLAFEGPQVIADRKTTSTFDGTVEFEGSGSHEYTLKIVQGGAADGTAKFRVSIDGGATWLRDENGVIELSANAHDGRVTLPGGTVDVFFNGTGDLVEGDVFQVVPKSALYWYETTSSKLNITPQILSNGQDNDRRLSGGSLAGYFQFRDAGVGAYREKLDAFSAALAWEVNRVHSQGAGLERFTEVIGTEGVRRADKALDSAEAGLFFGNRLTAGSLMVHVYSTTGEKLARSVNLDFGGGNFDPAVHTLQDVADAFNNVDGLSAGILDGRLQIKADDGFDFAFGADSTGLLAALGVNTFFEGSDARTLAVNPVVRFNLSFINAGHVNGAGEMNSGDNTTALAIAELQRKDVDIWTVSEGVTRQTLGEYFSTLVAKAGSDTQSAKFNAQYQKALADDLKARQDSVSGVNLDEEMTNLIKFQHAYTAAAKLITTADSMLQVLLGLKH